MRGFLKFLAAIGAFVLLVAILNVPSSRSTTGSFAYDAFNMVLNGNDYQYISTLREKALNGDISAQIELANGFRTGRIVKQNYDFAQAWFEKAASSGDRDVIYLLADFYDHLPDSIDDPYKNDKKSTETYYQAAIRGHFGAQYKLAYAYKVGKGLTKDYEKAKFWAIKSSQAGPDDEDRRPRQLVASIEALKKEQQQENLKKLGANVLNWLGNLGVASDRSGTGAEKPSVEIYDRCQEAKSAFAWSGGDMDVAAASSLGGCSPF